MTEAQDNRFPREHPPRESNWAAVAVVASLGVAAALFYDFWTPRVFLAGYDTYTHDYLMWQWGWEALLRDRRIPLWNPYLFGGWPFVASFAFCPFYPPAWLSVPLPTSLAITSQYALHLALGAVGFYAFARAMRVRPPLALGIALLYETSSHVATLAYPGHLAKVQAIAWMGWAMAGAVLLARDGRARWGLLLGAAWAMQLLASHTQIFYTTFWMAVLYIAAARAAARIAGRRQGAQGPATHPRVFVGVALAGLVAVSLSAAQMFPALELARRSNRASGVSFDDAAFGGLPYEELAEVVLPSFKGDSTGRLAIQGYRVPYVGRWHSEGGHQAGERLVSDYTGVWPVLLALAGIALSRQRKRWFFVLCALAAGAVSVGDATPLFRWAYNSVPGFDRFRSPATFMVAFNFALFALAALGIQGAEERLRRAGRTERGRLAFVCAVVGVVLGSTTYIFHKEIALRLQVGVLPGSDARGFLSGALLLGSLRHAGSFLSLGCFALAGILRFDLFRRPTALQPVLFLAIALMDAGSHVRHFFPRQPTHGLEEYLKNHWIENEILADAGNALLPACIEIAGPLNNRPTMRGVRSTHGYHPVVYGDYEKLLRATGGVESPVLQRHFAQNYLALDGAAPAPDGWRLLREKDGRRLFARDRPIPFARIPLRVAALGREVGRWEYGDTEAWRRLIGGEDFDSARTTIAEGYAWDARDLSDAVSSGSISVSCRMTRPGEFVLSLAFGSTDRSGAGEMPDVGTEGDLRQTARILSDSDGFIPCLVAVPAGTGWRVAIRRANDEADFATTTPAKERVEGDERVERLDPADWPKRANGFFLLVPLSVRSGAQTILSFRPAPVGLGLAVSGATLLGFLVLGLAIALRGRIRSRSDSDTDCDSDSDS